MASPSSSVFRKRFVLNGPLKRWFPGHMVQGMKLMQQKMQHMDCVIEVHDARIPMSGRNPLLSEGLARARPHILLLNKKDLTDKTYSQTVEERLQNQGIDKIIWTKLNSAKAYESGFDLVLPAVMQAVRKSDRYNRSDRPEINVMVMGIPNVGKSCLINRMRTLCRRKGGQPAAVGATAGVTRTVMERIKVSTDPLVYVLDTPGILEPGFKNIDSYMRLALCSSMSDEVIGRQNIADYALFWLNRNQNYEYLSYFDLGVEPSDCIQEVLFKIAVKYNYILKYKDLAINKTVPRPDLLAAAGVFVKAFRDGAFGKVMLDGDILRRGTCYLTNTELPFVTDIK